MARRVEWFPAELAALVPATDLPLSEWAEENRILDPINSGLSGPWRNQVTPYLRGIMDAMVDERIEEVSCVKATQMGLTEAALNLLLWIIAEDPGPTMLVYPRKEDCVAIFDHRIKELLRVNPVASRHLSARRADKKKESIVFDRMVLYFGASTAAADLASKAIRWLILDELDRYATWVPGEGSPLQIVRKRQRTFWNRKILKFSSPTTVDNLIWQEWLASDRRRYWVRCPGCGTWAWTTWANIRWPKEVRDPDEVKRDLLAWWECQTCRAKIRDRSIERERLIDGGKWAPEDARSGKDGPVGGTYRAHAGFHLPALLSTWSSWSDLVAEWLEAQTDTDKLQAFINTQLAEAWEENVRSWSESDLRGLCLNYPSGHVPEGARFLTAGVDVQLDHYFFVVRAWGEKWESWLVDHGRVESLLELETRVFDGAWSGRQVDLVLMDSGYDAWTVYDIAAARGDLIRPTKGIDSAKPIPYQATRVDRNKVTGAVYPGGLLLWLINVGVWKDKIMRFRSRPAVVLEAVGRVGGEAPGGWHLPIDVSDDYLAQVVGEKRVQERNRKTGRVRWVWRPKYRGMPSHYLDCEVLATVAADMLGVGSDAPPARAKRTESAKEGQDRPARKRGSWMSWK
ncbi:MAG: phage terminase large subunit family protein [Candidatus Omnitrophica bacterium]|jgi:phage terminase large subunit GpA-like protein|nr:phage terminase large subunit family protein [Candidatus Omnitrophota bacterium]